MGTSTHYGSMENPQMKNTEYIMDKTFHETKIVKTNFFALTLFSRVSDHGILYSPQANYRSVMAEYLKDRESHSQSMVDSVFSTKNKDIFNTNPMQVLFFQEKTLPENLTKKLPTCEMVSMAKETLNLGIYKIKDAKIKTDKYGVFPSRNAFLRLAFILGVEVAPPVAAEDKENPIFFDYTTILEFFGQSTLPTTTKSLKKFIEDNLKWKFFELGERPMWLNMWRLRSFFQALHPIGLAYVEGQHRGVLACKMLYGVDVAESYPLRFFTELNVKNKKTGDTVLPPDSPIQISNLEVKVLVPHVGLHMGEKRVITTNMLKDCRERSRVVAINKTLYITENWKTFIQNTLQTFLDDMYFTPITIESYLQIKMASKMKEGWNCLTGEMYNRNMIPFVNTCHCTVEKLVQAYFLFQPARDLTHKAKVDKEALLGVMNASEKVGFGAFSFFKTDGTNKNDNRHAFQGQQSMQVSLERPCYNGIA